MATSKQARTYTLLQCSPASVGLAQARPNYVFLHGCICMLIDNQICRFRAHYVSLLEVCIHYTCMYVTHCVLFVRPLHIQ